MHVAAYPSFRGAYIQGDLNIYCILLLKLLIKLAFKSYVLCMKKGFTIYSNVIFIHERAVHRAGQQVRKIKIRAIHRGWY